MKTVTYLVTIIACFTFVGCAGILQQNEATKTKINVNFSEMAEAIVNFETANVTENPDNNVYKITGVDIFSKYAEYSGEWIPTVGGEFYFKIPEIVYTDHGKNGVSNQDEISFTFLNHYPQQGTVEFNYHVWVNENNNLGFGMMDKRRGIMLYHVNETEFLEKMKFLSLIIN